MFYTKNVCNSAQERIKNRHTRTHYVYGPLVSRQTFLTRQTSLQNQMYLFFFFFFPDFTSESDVSVCASIRVILVVGYSVGKNWGKEWTGKYLQHQPELSSQPIREKPSKTVPLKLPSIRWVPFYPFLFIWFGCC